MECQELGKKYVAIPITTSNLTSTWINCFLSERLAFIIIKMTFHPRAQVSIATKSARRNLTYKSRRYKSLNDPHVRREATSNWRTFFFSRFFFVFFFSYDSHPMVLLSMPRLCQSWIQWLSVVRTASMSLGNYRKRSLIARVCWERWWLL